MEAAGRSAALRGRRSRRRGRGGAWARLPGTLLVLAAAGFPAGARAADDAPTAQWLKEQGAKVTLSQGAVTSVEVGDCSKWTDDDFRRLAALGALRDLSLGPGLTDHTLDLLADLPALQYLQTNESRVTDDGIRALARVKRLKNLKIFHPGRAFTGTGLGHLSELPELEQLTVAGSVVFGDAGMAAAAKLPHLKELRTWHAGQTLEGVKCLRNLPGLRRLTLGQRLAYSPPTTLSDETLDVLVELKALEFLRLEEARLKLESLLKLRQLGALKSLVLEGIDLPEGEVERLKQELPGVSVEWHKPNETYMKRIRQMFGP